MHRFRPGDVCAHSPIAVSPNNEARSPARSSKKGVKYEADATIGLGGFDSRWLLDRGGCRRRSASGDGKNTPIFDLVFRKRSRIARTTIRSTSPALHPRLLTTKHRSVCEI